MRWFTKTSLVLAALLLTCAAGPVAKADPVTITSGGFSLSNLGNDGTGVPGLDSLVGAPTTTTRDINVGGMGTFIALLNPLTFTTGFTGANSGGNHTFNFTQLLTINGQTQVMNIAGSIDIGHLVDTVHILSSAPLTYTFNNYTLTVEIIPTSIDGWGPGVFCGDLSARVRVNDCNPVPEPATLTLLGLGLAGVAAKLRQRRRARTS